MNKNINNNKFYTMKKLSFFLCATFIVLVAGSMLNVNGQTTHATALASTAAQTVNINGTFHYGVDSVERSGVSNVYTWSITGVPAPVAGTHYIMSPLAATNNAQKRIQWLVAGAYVVHLTEANPAANGSCSVTHGTIAVTVNATPTGTVGFTAATGTNQCSAAGAFTAALTATGTISYPITVAVSYTINGSTSAGTPITVASGNPLVVPAGVNFTSSLTDDAARTVTITGITDSFGGTIGINTTTGFAAQSLTIWALPVISTIHHD